ncbi:hypothetical protein, partial [Pelotomaculum propionicicum]|uniref:hypothetical protein n=1 Tax=Pelotomaculum propionicicum TaxID=258475 RepID=UPI0018646191
LAIFADKYPAKVTPVTVTSGQTTTVNVTLVPGDTDGNGLINIIDLRAALSFWEAAARNVAQLIESLKLN